MRIILMFDLPMESSKNKRDYRKFMKYLIQNGYMRIQYSVYSKLVMNSNVLSYHQNKLRANLPDNGKVQTIVVTENQYVNMEYLVGDPTEDELILTTSRTIEL